MVERSIQEMQIQVDQRYQHIKEKLLSLSTYMERYLAGKKDALKPTLEVLSKSIPAGSLFRVCQGLL